MVYIHTRGSITGSPGALILTDKCVIAAMNRNEAFITSSASSKSLFAIVVDYDYLVWLVVLRYLVVWLASFNQVVIGYYYAFQNTKQSLNNWLLSMCLVPGVATTVVVEHHNMIFTLYSSNSWFLRCTFVIVLPTGEAFAMM